MTDYFPRTLKHDLRTRGALLVAECIQIALSLTRALEHLHAHGLVHRDIKPSNIIFVKGVPKLADIGLVTSVDATRSFVGTDGYIPPEGPGTPPGDLYSLGKVLYECVTGKDRLDFPELPADWRTRPDFEQLLEVNEILTKACDGDPGQRYASAKGMLADLTILEVGESIKRRRTLQQRWAVCKKAGIAVVLVALATAAALFFVRDRRDGDLLSADPKVNALVEQGNLCILSETPERVSQALKYFKEAIDRDPQSVSAWFGLFQAYISHHGQAPGDWEMNLRATAQHLMEIDPLSTESHFASALIKWIDWQFRAALVEARAATTARAGSKQNLGLAHSLLGLFLLETGNPNEALEQAQLAERLLPATPMILSGLGQPYFVQRRFKEALEQFQKAEALEPRHLLGHRDIAQVYEATGDLMKAIDEYELGLETEHDAEAKRFWEELREAARKGGPKGYYRRQLELRLTGSKSNSYWVAESYAALPNKDEAYKWLTKPLRNVAGKTATK